MGCKDLDKLKGLVVQGEELIVKAEKVKEAMESCPTAKEVLVALFGDQIKGTESDADDAARAVVDNFYNRPLSLMVNTGSILKVDYTVQEALSRLGVDVSTYTVNPDLDELSTFFVDLFEAIDNI